MLLDKKKDISEKINKEYKDLTLTEKRRFNVAKARERRVQMAKEGTLKTKRTLLREEIETELRTRLTGKIEKQWDAIISNLLKKCKDKRFKDDKGNIRRIEAADLQAIIYAINQGAGKPTELQKVSADKQSLKTIEQQMRGWAGVKNAITKIPEPALKSQVSEVGDDPENAS